MDGACRLRLLFADFLSDNFGKVPGAAFPDEEPVEREAVPRGSAAEGCTEDGYDAVVTVYVLDAVPSLPHALRRISELLRPGGLWLYCGADPLRYLHPNAGHFTWEELLALLPAVGLQVLEERSVQEKYIPGFDRRDMVRCVCCRRGEHGSAGS
mmetsp:Transcript_123367/g.360210  ORF Transcript_123367/g.360210 Transcript_123367/m.360210 type:complete len:154 (-) Transcript_123367:38-499(-)